MDRVFNFSAGPSALPLEVLEKAQKELLNYKNTGMSVMEMSHRSKDFIDIAAETEQLFREIMEIPNNYKVLFLQGGGHMQFAMVPLNLLRKSKKADYVHTGMWTKRAMEEAKRYGEINVVASSEDSMFDHIPELDRNKFSKDADYFFIALNNTVYGTRYTTIPDTGDVPLIADASSSILSQVYNIKDYGLMFAGAQKNIGPSGLTVVIIREDLLGHAMNFTPTMLDYKVHADNDSMFNTPPTYGIYFAKLVLKWIKSLGGLSVMQKINEEKAKLVYDCLDNSKMFKGTVVKKDRSLMNIPFITGNEALDEKFIKEAKNAGLVTLKGYRTVGGMRASMYNGMPLEGAKALVEFMKKFEIENK